MTSLDRYFSISSHAPIPPHSGRMRRPVVHLTRAGPLAFRFSFHIFSIEIYRYVPGFMTTHRVHSVTAFIAVHDKFFNLPQRWPLEGHWSDFATKSNDCLSLEKYGRGPQGNKGMAANQSSKRHATASPSSKSVCTKHTNRRYPKRLGAPTRRASDILAPCPKQRTAVFMC